MKLPFTNVCDNTEPLDDDPDNDGYVDCML